MEEIKQMLRYIIEQQTRMTGKIVQLEREIQCMDGFDMGFDYVADRYRPLRELSISQEAIQEILDSEKPLFNIGTWRDAIRWAFKQGHLPESQRSPNYEDVAVSLESAGYDDDAFEDLECDVDDDD